jgi:hypothetical protein
VLYEPVVFAARVPLAPPNSAAPTDTLNVPEVFAYKEPVPTAVLLLAVFEYNADSPMAVTPEPVVCV